jgi:hypothetical protein
VDDMLADLDDGADEGSLSYAYCVWSAYIWSLEQVVVVDLPVSPAMSTFSLPMAFPFVVKGLLEGICMLGITSWGKLPDAPGCVLASMASSSPLDVTA